MKTSFWLPYLSDRTIHAICWTLIHSLWIGLVIALICGIVIATTSKSAAALRYRLLCSLLVLFLCAIGLTYYMEFRVPPPPPPVPPAMVINVQHNIILTHEAVSQNQTFLGNVQAFFDQNANIIFLVWLLFFVLKSLKLVSGLLYIQRIRNYKTHVVTEELKHKIEQLSSQIGIRRAVRLVQSELVKVPVAIGWLKPMILLPLGIALQLTPEQLDGILWHELAHIYRRDYLVNILQGLVETVFFFNPGLLWLSSLIRTEREAYCDDMVLCRMNHKANYLEALLSFGYGEFKQAGLAMSIGSGNQLRDRLKRIINQENKRLSVVEKTALLAGLIALSAFTSLPKTAQRAAQQLVNEMIKMPVQKTPSKAISADLLKQRAASHPTAGLKMIDTPYGKIDSLVNLSSMSTKKGNYDHPIIVTDINAEDIHGKKYHFTLADNMLVAMEINGEKIKNNDLSGYQYMADMFRNKGKADGVVLAKRLNAGDQSLQNSRFIADTAIHFYNLHFEGDALDKSNYTAFAEDATSNKYKIVVTNKKLVALSINGNDVQKSDLPKYAYLLKHIPSPPPPPPAPPGGSPDKPQEPQQPSAPPSLDKMIGDVTNDLINEHIIKDKSGLSTVKLTYSELIVNGVKQPDEVQKKFAGKYYPGNARLSKDPNYGLWYNAKTHGVALGTFNLDLDAL